MALQKEVLSVYQDTYICGIGERQHPLPLLYFIIQDWRLSCGDKVSTEGMDGPPCGLLIPHQSRSVRGRR